MYVRAKDQCWNLFRALYGFFDRFERHRVGAQSEDFSDESIFIFTNDEHNALVVAVLMERHGLNVRWVSSEDVSRFSQKLENSLIIYDIPSIEVSGPLNHYESYFKQVDNLPWSAVLVGLGSVHDIPIEFSPLFLRTVTFLSKPFDISDAISALGLVSFNADDPSG